MTGWVPGDPSTLTPTLQNACLPGSVTSPYRLCLCGVGKGVHGIVPHPFTDPRVDFVGRAQLALTWKSRLSCTSSPYPEQQSCFAQSALLKVRDGAVVPSTAIT